MTASSCSSHCCNGDPVLSHLCRLYRGLLAHDGYAELRLDIRILKKGQKEVIISCGKQYRYIVDFPTTPTGQGMPDMEENASVGTARLSTKGG